MRLVTRGNLDGLVSTVLISTMEDIESVELAHPQDIEANKIEISQNDILANLPYHPDCGMWFDHHPMREGDRKPPGGFHGKYEIAPSVARVIFRYYDSDALKKYEYLLNDTDRFDGARLELDDITDPQGIILLGFTIDPRTSIGAFKDYFFHLAQWLKDLPVEEVLKKPEVEERIKLIKESNESFARVLKENSRLDGNVIITDFRDLDTIPVGNRFLIYSLYPGANVSVRLQWGPEKKFVAASLGHSIFNRTCKTNCGDVCNNYGGGGHKGAGSCPLDIDKADRQIEEIVALLKDKDQGSLIT